jgi:hypothetical protein
VNLKAILSAIASSRKNTTLLSGVLLGLLLAAQYPALVDEVRRWVGELGMGGLIAYAVSVYMSTTKAKTQKETVIAALYQPPPVSREDEKAALRAIQ